jgi:hypothetical protein
VISIPTIISDNRELRVKGKKMPGRITDIQILTTVETPLKFLDLSFSFSQYSNSTIPVKNSVLITLIKIPLSLEFKFSGPERNLNQGFD